LISDPESLVTAYEQMYWSKQIQPDLYFHPHPKIDQLISRMMKHLRSNMDLGIKVDWPDFDKSDKPLNSIFRDSIMMSIIKSWEYQHECRAFGLNELLQGIVYTPEPEYTVRNRDDIVDTVKWRTRGDWKPNSSKKFQKRAKIKSWSYKDTKQRQYRYVQNIKKLKKGLPEKEKIIEKVEDVPKQHRQVNYYSLLTRAVRYVSDGAHADYFSHSNEFLDAGIQVILGHIESRRRKSKRYDLKEILSMSDQVVNEKLFRWSSKDKKEVISLEEMMKGHFMTDKGKHVYLPVMSDIVVSKKYDAEHFITSDREMLLAVRKIRDHRITDISYFNILDPVTQTIIEYCLETGLDGHKPEAIVRLEPYDLKLKLSKNGLLDEQGNSLQYRFHFTKDHKLKPPAEAHVHTSESKDKHHVDYVRMHRRMRMGISSSPIIQNDTEIFYQNLAAWQVIQSNSLRHTQQPSE